MDFVGLSSSEAKDLQEKYGRNELSQKKKETLFQKIISVICEPMFLLLLVASAIYFVLGETRDAIIMLIAVVGIITIEAIQEWKTDRTLNALKDLSAPHIKVIRDNTEMTILSVDLVPGDIIIITEGVKIPADGVVLKYSDLYVDESSLTGESVGVWKTTSDKIVENSDYWRRDYVYAGTLVTCGSGYIKVDKIGIDTEYGKIGFNVASAPDRPTPLEKQTAYIVKVASIFAFLLFIAVSVITYFNLDNLPVKGKITESVLSGVVLAMAMIPEEFPVILTVFLSMGAWRIAKKSALIRKLPAVETLGAVSVLCVDKTGTITKNKMTLSESFIYDCDYNHLSTVMGMACEINPYDPMEKAMIEHCYSIGLSDNDLFSGELVKEYAFTDENKMMGHVWSREDYYVICAKGSPEKIFDLCDLSEEDKEKLNKENTAMARKGLRVIAVAKQKTIGIDDIPNTLTDCKLKLCGLVGLFDPPRETVKADIAKCVKAGIRVVMITGDNGFTASSIAEQIGIPHSDRVVTGDMLNSMSDEDLREMVKKVNIFSRVIPEHKMRIVNAFKENGEVVAMTGDGVNDAPALKHSDIGIAMGKRGSEVSREAADLILIDDNFSTIVDTVRDGRRIYDNIQKAIGYVFTIHIPIALACLFAPFLKIPSTALMLLPLHVILLELIIDPTCSIVLERQPAEPDVMDRKPRKITDKIFTFEGFAKSGLQGLIIFIASFVTYLKFLENNGVETLARTMGVLIILFANIFLVWMNSSNYEYTYISFIKLYKDKVMWLVNGGILCAILLFTYTPLNEFLKFHALNFKEFIEVIVISAASVFWYELVKVYLHIKKKYSKVSE